MGAVALANRTVKLFKLDNAPQEVKTDESPLKYQVNLWGNLIIFLESLYFHLS